MSEEAVTEVIEFSRNGQVTCGGCNLDSGPYSNISKSRLVKPYPKAGRVKNILYTIEEIENWEESMRQTWFTGFSLHTMPVDLWRQYPFKCYPGSLGNGYASDYHLCWRLQLNNILIVALKAGRIHHIRKDIEKQDFKVLAGIREKNIRWEE